MHEQHTDGTAGTRAPNKRSTGRETSPTTMDVRVMATGAEPASYNEVVVTSTPHSRDQRWHVAGCGVAVNVRGGRRSNAGASTPLTYKGFE